MWSFFLFPTRKTKLVISSPKRGLWGLFWQIENWNTKLYVFSPLSDIIFHVTSINAFFTNFYHFLFFYYFRHSIVRQLTDDGSHHLPAHVPEKFHSQENVKANNKLTKQTTIGDLENIHLNPKVEGRIRVLTGRVSFKLSANIEPNLNCFI